MAVSAAGNAVGKAASAPAQQVAPKAVAFDEVAYTREQQMVGAERQDRLKGRADGLLLVADHPGAPMAVTVAAAAVAVRVLVSLVG